MGWQWHQLDHMQIICTSLQTDNHASTSPLSFYRPDALPATQPTASKHWGHKVHLENRTKMELVVILTASYIEDSDRLQWYSQACDALSKCTWTTCSKLLHITVNSWIAQKPNLKVSSRVYWKCSTRHWRTTKKWGWTMRDWIMTNEFTGVDSA